MSKIKKIMPSYNDFMAEKLLLEMGELVKPYKFNYEGHHGVNYEYSFISKDKLEYSVWFKEFGRGGAYEFIYTLKDWVGSGDKAFLTNKNDVMPVLSTLIYILKDFYKKSEFNYIIANGSPTEEEEKNKVEVTKRAKLYFAILKKNMFEIFGNFHPEVTLNKSQILIDMTKITRQIRM